MSKILKVSDLLVEEEEQADYYIYIPITVKQLAEKTLSQVEGKVDPSLELVLEAVILADDVFIKEDKRVVFEAFDGFDEEEAVGSEEGGSNIVIYDQWHSVLLEQAKEIKDLPAEQAATVSQWLMYTLELLVS
jgi:hypothetical protein